MTVGFEFNKAYVIESLGNERKTGQELYDDLLSWQAFQLKDFEASLYQPVTKQDFLDNIEEIKFDAISNGKFPILHLEMHGKADKSGMVFTSGESISWFELYDILVGLNTVVNNNLFLTLGVCMGGYLMQIAKPLHPSPFWGFIGSFEVLYNTDILIRYNEFYTVLLSSLDLMKAFDALKTVNTGIPADYRFINTETLFQRIYKKYSETQFSQQAIKSRFEEAARLVNINFKDEDQKNSFFIKFQAELTRSKKEFFDKHKRTFFMLDLYPENSSKFLKDWSPF